MAKPFFVLIFVLILLSSIVIASPPFLQKDFSGTTGLELKVPQILYIPLNSITKMHVHLFNATNGVPIFNDTASCYAHIYNHSGAHIVQTQLDFSSNGLEFETEFNSSITKNLGRFDYIIWCNSSNQGGFIAAAAEVTNSGRDETNKDGTAGISITLFILMVIIGLIIVALKVDFVNEKEGKAAGAVANLIIRNGLIAISIYLMMTNAAILATIASYSGLPLTSEMFLYMNLFSYAGYIALMCLGIKSLIGMFDIIEEKKVQRRTGEGYE